jgi:hypothetical protein
MSLSGRDRLEALFKLFPGLKKGLEENDKKMAAIKEKRQGTNALITRARVEAETAAFFQDVPKEPVDVSSVLKQIQGISDFNANNAALRTNKQAISDKITSYVSDVDAAQATVADLTAKLAAANAEVSRITSLVETTQEAFEAIVIPEDKSSEELSLQIQNAEAINSKVRANADRAKKQEELATLTRQYSQQGDEAKAIEKNRSDLLSGSAMPIPGLSVTDQEITYKGIPLDKLSTGEKIRVCATIHKTENPGAKVVLIDDASLLDSKNTALVNEIYEGYQKWIILNDETGCLGVVIEEGRVVKVN